MVEPTDRSREDDWFRQNERQIMEQARQAREKRERERAALETTEQRQALRAAHWMKCPKCGHDLAEQDLSGVKVDRCTFCEGFFLDAGEFEELAKRSRQEAQGIFRRMLGI